MTVVYLDSLFLLNLGLDALLLRAAGQLSRASGSWRRTLLAALLGAFYAVGVFTLPWPWLNHPVTRLALSMGMARLCTRRRSGALLGAFLLLALSLAGAVVLMSAAGLGRMSHSSGLPVCAADARLLFLCAAGEYLVCCAVAALTRRAGSACVPVLLRCEDRSVLLQAMVDSGNLLRDPVTGAPVLVVSPEQAAGLFPPGVRPTEDELRRPETALPRLSRLWSPGRLRLLPFQAVGRAQGLLLAVRLDRLEVGGRVCKGRLAAISPDPLPEGYGAIIGTDEGGLL